MVSKDGQPNELSGEVTDVVEFAVQVNNTQGLGELGDTLLDVIMTEVVADYLLADVLTGMAAAYPIPSFDLGEILPILPLGSNVSFNPNSLEWKAGYLELRGGIINPK